MNTPSSASFSARFADLHRRLEPAILLLISFGLWAFLNVGFGTELLTGGSVGPWAVLTTAAASIVVVLGSAIVVAMAWLTAHLLAVAFRSDSNRTRHVLFLAVLGVIAALGGVVVGGELAAGKWVSQQSWSWSIPWVVASGAGIGTAGATRLALSRRLAGWITTAFAVSAAALAWVDANLLVGLYLEIHLTLYAVGALACLAFGARLTRLHGMSLENHSRVRRLAVNAMVVLLSVASGILLLATPEQGRSELVLQGGTLAAVHEAVAPKKPTDRLGRQLEAIRAHDPPLKFDQRSSARPEPLARNVVLIMVDALRADALEPARSEPAAGGFIKPEHTPFLNDYLEGCHRFRRAYAQSSATHRSIPPTFHSIRAWENAKRQGTPLGTAMQVEGMETFAVVNNYFFEPRFMAARRLLTGFGRVLVYPSDDQKQMLDLTERAFADRSDRPMFGWIHFFSVHDPGYDDEKLSKTIPRETRYRRGVKWFDASMNRVISQMREHGALEDTAIVLASDHGEGLGQHDVGTHGPHVYEEAVRVPLAVCLPDRRGSVIDAAVGNIDIVPTIRDMIGAPPDPAHRGRSLVPLLTGEASEHPDIPYFENWNGKRVGLFRDPYKLIYHEKSDLMFRFDVHEDPDEDDNLHASGSDFDSELTRALFRINPSLLRSSMRRLQNRRDVRDALATVDPAAPNRSLPFLLTLGSYTHGQSPKIAAHARRIFEDAGRNEVRLLVTRRFGHYKRFARPIQKTVDAIEDPAERTELVDGLASAPLTRLDGKWVAKHLRSAAEPDAWTAWLRLLKRQPSVSVPELNAVGRLLERAADDRGASEVPAPVVRLALSAVAKPRRPAPQGLVDRIEAFLEHEDALVRAEAVGALGRLGDASALAAVEAAAVDREGQELVVRQAAVYALAELGGEKTADTIVEAATDPYIALDGIEVLYDLDALDQLVQLRKIHRKHFNRFIRGEARRAVKKLRKRRKEEKQERERK